MVTTAEFEEKTYEKYFGHEFAGKFPLTYSPGQRAEFHLGFDETFYVDWEQPPWPLTSISPSSWLKMPGFTLSEIDDLADHVSDYLPPFRFNFFVQYKRPEYVSGPRGKERQDWGSPYFRYFTMQHQQEALERLHALACGRAVVVYAAPAFWTSIDLFTATFVADIGFPPSKPPG